MILVADQNRTSADLLVRRLRADGIEAQAVGSAALARKVIDAAVARSILQAIILDPALPGGGLELLRQLRLDANTAATPVIVFGTSDAPEEVAAARRYGASAVMLKGRVTPSQLMGCLRTLLAGPAPAAASPPELGEYFLWIQPTGGDAQRLTSDLGRGPGLRCSRCKSVMSLYLKRDPRWGDWLMAKVGCLMCARKQAAAQAPRVQMPGRETQIEPVGGLT